MRLARQRLDRRGPSKVKRIGGPSGRDAREVSACALAVLAKRSPIIARAVRVHPRSNDGPRALPRHLHGAGHALHGRWRRRWTCAALARLVEYQIAEGVRGLIPLGSHRRVPVRLARGAHRHRRDAWCSAAAGRVPVLIGTGAEDTREVVRAVARRPRRQGADGVMIIPPFYSVPTRAGAVPPLRHGGEGDRHPDHGLQQPGDVECGHDAGDAGRDQRASRIAATSRKARWR